MQTHVVQSIITAAICSKRGRRIADIANDGMATNLGIANHTHSQEIALGNLQGVKTFHKIVNTEGEAVEVGAAEILGNGDLTIDMHMSFLLVTFSRILPEDDR